MPHPQDSNAVVRVQGLPLPDQERAALADLIQAQTRLELLTGPRNVARVFRNLAASMERRA